MAGRSDPAGIKDVARLAGVSVGTVSNVLNKPSAVSAERRAQVERAIEQLGYVPNVAARQLKAGVSRAVGLVVVDTQNPFYGSIALEAEEAAEELGLGLFVANSHRRHAKEEFYLSQFEQQRARGVLVTPGSSDLGRHRAVVRRGTRVVLVDAVDHDDEFCTVSADDFHGGYLAVKHLVETGRRRITVIGGPPQFRQIGRRHAGALQAASESSGVELHYVAPPEMSILAGRAATEEIVDSGRGWPDAIFAMNDLLAIGALQALVMSRSIDVPGDIALVGYDDIDFCANAVVPITSVRQPSAEMGRRAIELLEAEIRDGAEHRHRSVVLKPELVVRESTAGQ
ncbi:LacI family DNA-binding transcriptional regulator [Tessaracoccus antarcticus]|uniref:LacI family transcriptional regulator n=1 Tax=Tessaracoccus antarcticus TaxID=2479848 RepID=A0A3M0FZG0_9ACTN|nr:LacI family DNA-binding transcriptional regulator [Tessaracoccus antarcticus]RMB57808.1 LacI family transcriptional regulator [Tessaracoccus antarcticus]